VGGICQHCNST